MLFIEHAASKLATETDVAAAIRWSKQLSNFATKSKDKDRFETSHSLDMVFDGYPKAKL